MALSLLLRCPNPPFSPTAKFTFLVPKPRLGDAKPWLGVPKPRLGDPLGLGA